MGEIIARSSRRAAVLGALGAYSVTAALLGYGVGLQQSVGIGGVQPGRWRRRRGHGKNVHWPQRKRRKYGRNGGAGEAGGSPAGGTSGGGQSSGGQSSGGQAGGTSTPGDGGPTTPVVVLGPSITAGDPGAADVAFDVHDDEGRARHLAVSIYGTNGAPTTSTKIHQTVVRSGGNRLTAYNWENNASNAGSDYQFQNDGLISRDESPGKPIATVHGDGPPTAPPPS